MESQARTECIIQISKKFLYFHDKVYKQTKRLLHLTVVNHCIKIMKYTPLT